MHTPGFPDRHEAGRALAGALTKYRASDPVVVGLTRGGVPVARELGAPFDIWVVRKIGAPVQAEFALGAVTEGGEVVLDDASVSAVGATPEEVAELVRQKLSEVESRVRLYRHGAPPFDIRGRTVIVVDDGLATGGTARAALRALRRRGARQLILAVPVAAGDALPSLREEADEIVCLFAPRDFHAVGIWYGDFQPTTDAEVERALAEASARTTAPSDPAPASAPFAKTLSSRRAPSQ